MKFIQLGYFLKEQDLWHREILLFKLILVSPGIGKELRADKAPTLVTMPRIIGTEPSKIGVHFVITKSTRYTSDFTITDLQQP